MWRSVGKGVEFTGPKAAFRSLRERAKNAIAEGDQSGFDVRGVKVRLKDDADEVLFEGTMDEAARLEIDGRIFLPQNA